MQQTNLRVMQPVRQRLLLGALRFRSSARNLAKRGSASIQRQGPVLHLMRDLFEFSRRHRVSVDQWDADYAAGDYAERLDTITHVTHHAAILGYLTYGAAEPRILDVGCGHGRLLQLLAGFDFSEYVGIDWSSQAVERAQSLAIPHTRIEVADMNHWDTTQRFDAIVLNNCLAYADDPLKMFERALEWLGEGGLVVVSMYRDLGARYIWAGIESAAIEQVAACAVKDDRTGAVWNVKALRIRPLPPVGPAQQVSRFGFSPS